MPAHMTGSGYLIEFIPSRSAVKVSAIDPVTGTEVSIVASPSASQAHMERVAVKKLEYVLGRDASDSMSGGQASRAEGISGPGRIV